MARLTFAAIFHGVDAAGGLLSLRVDARLSGGLRGARIEQKAAQMIVRAETDAQILATFEVMKARDD